MLWKKKLQKVKNHELENVIFQTVFYDRVLASTFFILFQFCLFFKWYDFLMMCVLEQLEMEHVSPRKFFKNQIMK